MPIAALLVALSAIAAALDLGGPAVSLVAAVDTAALYVLYVRRIERRRVVGSEGALAALARGAVLGGLLFAAVVVALSVLGVCTIDGEPLITGGAFGPEASIVAVAICLAAGIAGLVVAHRRGHFVPAFWRR